MKIPWWAIVVGALILLGGAYMLGRADAPDGDDAVTQSLLDGIEAYHAAYNTLTRQVNEASRAIAAGKRRERELAATRTPTPVLVPAGCEPWASNLSTCDQQVAELRGTVADAERILGLTAQARAADSAHADSLRKALKREVGKGRILGVKLPSRKSSFLAGGVLGSLVIGGACVLAR